VKTQFNTFAGEGKSIDKKKFQEDPNLNGMLGLFDFADRNSDGKIDKKEVEAALKALTTLIGCRADVTITDQGRGLFELLDRDGDGRLSPRELASAHTLIAGLDTNGDGLLDKTEVPKVIAAAAVPASAQVISATNGYFDGVTFANQPAVPRILTAGGAPEWFLKMDRNGDGDLSPREFLGPLELFRELDTDGDGLISVEEAKAYEKRRKK
jgi:Ca2+-binding EF-hand superfamily protein